MDLATRTAVLTDVPDLLRFWAEAGENAARPADKQELVEQLIQRDPEAVIVAELNGTIVATIVCGWDGWRASLYRLAVSPEQRRRGLARHMLTLAEERLRALGAERFHAMVLDDNERGQTVWRASGYAPQETWTRWIKPVDTA